MADEPKPPFVRFEIREVEDRNATIAQGHYVGRDVIFVKVSPVGTKDTIEAVAEDWIKNVEEGVKQERIPEAWLHAFRRALEDFKNSRETPEEGTSIKEWPVASPAQVRMLLDINVTTVEHLADANEETVSRLGMGGRALKQKARAWLDSAQDTGKVTEEINALREENRELKERDEIREKEFQELKKAVELLQNKDEKEEA